MTDEEMEAKLRAAFAVAWEQGFWAAMDYEMDGHPPINPYSGKNVY